MNIHTILAAGIILAGLMEGPDTMAQSKANRPAFRHEISFSWGGSTGGLDYSGESSYYDGWNLSDGIPTLADMYDSTYGYTKGDVYGLTYDYCVSDWFLAGLDLSYSELGCTVYPGSAYTHRIPCEYRYDLYSIMPRTKMVIPLGKWVSYYACFGLGVRLKTGNDEGVSAVLAWQIMPGGFEFGGKHFFGFFEYGVGNNYYGRFGFGFRL